VAPTDSKPTIFPAAQASFALLQGGAKFATGKTTGGSFTRRKEIQHVMIVFGHSIRI
jgi:hypothetical protein